jgi:DNA-binding YbaB/EbfC family protein
MFEGMDLNNISKMMENLQNSAEEFKKKSKETIITSKGGGGMVQVSANGLGEIVDITIDDSLMEDKEALQILLISTINDVLKSVEQNRASQAMNFFSNVKPFGK